MSIIFYFIFPILNHGQTFFIGDYVWHDTNGNGLQDAGENGLVTTVTLFNTTTNTVVATTMSNSDGVYFFTNVSPDYYKLHFAPIPGYFRSPTNNTSGPWGDLGDSDPYQDGWTDEIPLDFNVNTIDAGYTTVLPIKLKSFKAVMGKGISNLSFTTASEINNAGFDIERSADGITFEKIGWVDGHGSTTEEIHYTFTDTKPLFGINYYRLRQMDYDGRFEYSKIVNVGYTSDDVYLYPNPATDILHIQNLTKGDYLIKSIAGIIMGQGILADDRKVDISHLPQGTYLFYPNSSRPLIFNKL